MSVGDVTFGRGSVVVLFVRRESSGEAFGTWRASLARDGSRLVVAVAGQSGTSTLPDALEMRAPNDGGPPVSYATVDRHRQVRDATLGAGAVAPAS